MADYLTYNASSMAILLVPGFMADESLWSEITRHLEAFGPVSYADFAAGDSIEAMARQALERVPGKLIVAGFSMGGYVAREIARIAPDRVQALVLIATSARADTPGQAGRKALAVENAGVGQFKGLSTISIRASIHPSRSTDKALVERIRGMSVRLGRDAFIRQSSLKRESDLDRLGEISCPTLVIAAREDRLRSLEESQELEKGIPGASLRTIEGSGHMIPLEAPRNLAQEMVAWLRDQRKRGRF